MSPNTMQVISPPGSYANEGILFTCPAGRFGASYGLSSPLCSGSCSKGFYCPPGSVSPREWACGGPSLICPAGAGWPIMVDEGCVIAGGAERDFCFSTLSNGLIDFFFFLPFSPLPLKVVVSPSRDFVVHSSMFQRRVFPFVSMSPLFFSCQHALIQRA